MLFLNAIFVTFISKNLKRAISNLKILKQKKGSLRFHSIIRFNTAPIFQLLLKRLFF